MGLPWVPLWVQLWQISSLFIFNSGCLTPITRLIPFSIEDMLTISFVYLNLLLMLISSVITLTLYIQICLLQLKWNKILNSPSLTFLYIDLINFTLLFFVNPPSPLKALISIALFLLDLKQMLSLR